MHNDASSTKLSLRVPLEEAVPIAEAANQNGSTLFGHISALISRELNLNAMSLDLSASAQYLRLNLTMPVVVEAMKLHKAAQAKRVSTGDWIAQLLAQNTPVSPSAGRDLSPIGRSSWVEAARNSNQSALT